MKRNMDRRTFLKVAGSAVLAGALAGCGGSNAGSGNNPGGGSNPGGGDDPGMGENPGGGENPGSSEEPGGGETKKGYYTASTPDAQGVYWTYYYDGFDAQLTGYNRNKGAKPTGSVTLPGVLDGIKVTGIDMWAFSMLEKISYGEQETENYTKSDFSLVTELTIPAGYGFIGQDAFDACVNAGVGTHRTSTSLRKVNFLGKTTLANNAFYDCDKLSEIKGIDNITILTRMKQGGCFYNTAFQEIKVTNDMMQDGTFAECKKLTAVTIQEGIGSIAVEIFEDCNALCRIYIPVSVKKIGSNAFNTYTADEVAPLTVYYGGSETQWKALMQKTERGNDRLRSAAVHYNSSPDDVK